MKKIYEVSYASGMFRDRNRQKCAMFSNSKLKIGEFVVIEHKGCGVFIGQIDRDITKDVKETYGTIEGCDREYHFVQRINLDKYIKNIENAKRKEELKNQMQERFKVIDEDIKFRYYAGLDEEISKLYEEYKNL